MEDGALLATRRSVAPAAVCARHQPQPTLGTPSSRSEAAAGASAPPRPFTAAMEPALIRAAARRTDAQVKAVVLVGLRPQGSKAADRAAVQDILHKRVRRGVRAEHAGAPAAHGASMNRMRDRHGVHSIPFFSGELLTTPPLLPHPQAHLLEEEYVALPLVRAHVTQ